VSRNAAAKRFVRLAAWIAAVLLVSAGAWLGTLRLRYRRWEKGFRVTVPHGRTLVVDGIEVRPENLDRLRRHARWVVLSSGRQWCRVALVLDPDPDATFAEMDAAALQPFREAVPGGDDLFPDEGPRISFHPVFELDGVRREFVLDDPWHEAWHSPLEDVLWVAVGTERLVVGGRVGNWRDLSGGNPALDAFVADATNLGEAFIAVGVEPDVPFERVKDVLRALCAACPTNHFCFFDLR
jgi:hypothetical protein